MSGHDEASPEVDRFLLECIDTVPHLEALLLLWHSRPKSWTVEEMSKALFVAPEAAREILDDLLRERLISAASKEYWYEPNASRDHLIELVGTTYRRQLIRITRLIHSKPSAAVREFARAFRFKKERE